MRLGVNIDHVATVREAIRVYAASRPDFDLAACLKYLNDEVKPGIKEERYRKFLEVDMESFAAGCRDKVGAGHFMRRALPNEGEMKFDSSEDF